MRHGTLSLLATLGVSFILASAPRTVLAAGTPTPTAVSVAAPSTAALYVSGAAGPLTANAWVNVTAVTVKMTVDVAAGQLTPQAEIQSAATAFTNQPNFTGDPVSASGPATVQIQSLRNGTQYHVQVRVVDNQGNPSAWVPLAGSGSGPDFGIDTTAPSRPVISSASNPDQNRWYNTATPTLTWSSKDRESGIRGYSFVLERTAKVIPPGSITPQSSARLQNLTDGVWFLALRAVDRAGNWSPTGTFRLQIDRTAPRLRRLSPHSIPFNPYKGPASVRFTASKSSSVTLSLYRVGSSKPILTYYFAHVVPGRAVTVTWSGKAKNGKPVPKGYYFFSATASDRAQNLTRVDLGGFAVTPRQAQKSESGQALYPGDGKRIIVSLSRETLYAYDGDRLQMRTFVTTGNPSLPTPLGRFSVTARYHPYEFISPWPEGSPYYYTPSLSQYAMLFRDGGYFLHDAPWRSAFGPGTNGAGQPGTNYGGTHGCVNIPPGPMLFLWNWTPIGTTVDIVP